MYNVMFIDVSEFVTAPLRTGVQRVLVKIIENLPRRRIMPFRVVDPAHVAILDPAIFDVFIRFFNKLTLSQRALAARDQGLSASFSEEEHLIQLIGQAPLAVLIAGRFYARAERIINLESFSSPDRSRFYINCPSNHRNKVAHFIHDFLLFEQPHVFPQLNWRYATDNILLFEAYCAAGEYFVASEELKTKAARYFNRSRSDIKVVHFGGDIGPTSGSHDLQEVDRRRRVLAVGTIEPRKYPLEVASALDELAVRHPGLECIVAGNIGWVSPEINSAIEAIFAGKRVRHIQGLGDSDLSSLINGTDVALYVSSTEGFGLPVIEYAARGIPLVTNSAVPAAHVVDDPRAEVIEKVTPAALVEAVERQLFAPHDRTPYYTWTWSHCAAEIAALRASENPAHEPVFDPATSWQAAIRLVREFRDDPPEWEELKRLVQSRLFPGDAKSGLLGSVGVASDVDTADQVEQVSEIVSDNMRLIYWADKVATQPLLLAVIRCVFTPSPLEGLSRAYTIFLGRPIDPNAASEAVAIQNKSQQLRRIVDLINSDEATCFLDEPRRIALRSLLRDAMGFLEKICESRLDLSNLLQQLGTATPSLEDVVYAEERREAGIPPILTALFFSHRRKLRGDSIDQWLDAIARAIRDRNIFGYLSSLTSSIPAEDEGSVSATVSSLKKIEHLENADVGDPVSAQPAKEEGDFAFALLSRRLPLNSALLTQGWHEVENEGVEFRWMGRQAVVINPEPLRVLSYLRLSIMMVYGADEPFLTASIDGKKAEVEIVWQLDGNFWQVDIFADQSETRHGSVTITAVVTDSPARAEHTDDERELSLAISSLQFVYRTK